MSRVESYSGSTYPEKPRVLVWKNKRYQVEDVLHRFREPERLCFTVLCSPGRSIFELDYNILSGEWQIQPKGFASNEGMSKHSPNNTGE